MKSRTGMASQPNMTCPQPDAVTRYRTYGPIVPMDRPGFFERLFLGRR